MNNTDWCLFLYQHNDPVLLLRAGSLVWSDLSHRLTWTLLREQCNGLTCNNNKILFCGTFIDIPTNTKNKLEQMYYDGVHIDILTKTATQCLKSVSLSSITF